jgi:hypothetical protein
MATWPFCSLVHILITSLADFGHPSGSTLGLFTAIVNIGAFSALFFCGLPCPRLSVFETTCSSHLVKKLQRRTLQTISVVASLPLWVVLSSSLVS